MAAKLSAAAKARNDEKRKKQNERVKNRIKEAVAKAVAKCNEKWKAKLIEERKKKQERVNDTRQKLLDRNAERKEKKRINFWERKIANGSALEIDDGYDGKRRFSYF